MGFWAKEGLPAFGLTQGVGAEEREALCSMDALGAIPSMLQAEAWAAAICTTAGGPRASTN